MSQIKKIDILIDYWLDTICVPTDEQVKILTRLRDSFTGQSKKKIDIRLQNMSDAELIGIIENGSPETL